jgi:hypothetical protein
VGTEPQPFAEQNQLEGSPPDQVIPPHSATLPDETFQQMAPGQVVLVATFELPDMTPAPTGNPTFPDATLPLDIRSFDREVAWEGQPPGTLVRYQALVRANDQYLRLDLYVGASAPTSSMLSEAQLELERLVVPSGLASRGI